MTIDNILKYLTMEVEITFIVLLLIMGTLFFFVLLTISTTIRVSKLENLEKLRTQSETRYYKIILSWIKSQNKIT